uniref:Uncharacterized protein n=1 Tax=Lepeophtheirus salmonis TaxID=72036 RepID=A0A0K2UI26_LEPSM
MAIYVNYGTVHPRPPTASRNSCTHWERSPFS